jgi:hypothetical protein
MLFMRKFYALVLLISGLVNSQIVTIPDPVFKARLLNSSSNFTAGIGTFLTGYYGNYIIDQNNDGEIQVSEAQLVQYLDLKPVPGSPDTIYNLTGIESFTTLEILKCPLNNLTSLDLSGNVNLYEFNAENNDLNSLNLDGLTKLKYLFLKNNHIASIDFSSLADVEIVGCANNLFSILDFSPNPKLVDLGGANNPNLTYVSVKNGMTFFNSQIDVLQFDGFYNCPNLSTVCADEEERQSLQNALDSYAGHPINCTSNCSLSLGDVTAIVTFYPNPTKGNIIINANSIIDSVDLIDIQGRILLTQYNSTAEMNLDINGYGKGVYLLKVYLQDGSKSEKIIKE